MNPSDRHRGGRKGGVLFLNRSRSEEKEKPRENGCRTKCQKRLNEKGAGGIRGLELVGTDRGSGCQEKKEKKKVFAREEAQRKGKTDERRRKGIVERRTSPPELLG